MFFQFFRRINLNYFLIKGSYFSYAKINISNIHGFPPPFESVFGKAKTFRERIAIVDNIREYKYKDLITYSCQFARTELDILRNNCDKQQKVVFLCPSDVTYVITQWACWMKGVVAVPLCDKHPPNQLEYYVKDSECSAIVVSTELFNVMKPIGERYNLPVIKISYPNSLEQCDFDENNNEWAYKSEAFCKLPAMFVYTSGTTGFPKGVILTHENLYTQASSVNNAWEIKSNDTVMHALPMHHLHGILNGLISPLICGAKVILLPKFDPEKIWKYLLGDHKHQPTIFHAVPTMYSLLIRKIKEKHPLEKVSFSRTMEFIKAFCTTNIKFMACGSASLPTTILREWERITGHTLLERYGMTELGMVFTNPLHGKRVPGSVGQPFPGVQVRIGIPNAYSKTGYDIVAEGDREGTTVRKGRENDIGELLIKGPNVFAGYWNKREATKQSFTIDGWFKTGDTAQYDNGNYRILGRTSIDIIKSGGFKISSLDIECQLLSNPKIQECAVVGLPDITWGEKVAAIVVENDGFSEKLSLEELRLWCRDKLPSYSIPTVLVSLSQLPKNLLGKVNKKELLKQVFSVKKV